MFDEIMIYHADSKTMRFGFSDSVWWKRNALFCWMDLFRHIDLSVQIT